MRCKEASLLLLVQGAEFATTRVPPLLTRPAMRDSPLLLLGLLAVDGLAREGLDDLVDTGLALALAPACQCRRAPLAAPAALSDFPHSNGSSHPCSSIVVDCSAPTSFETHRTRVASKTKFVERVPHLGQF